ncbi:hypothetical protein EKO04_006477 [Ascochyta lentis]|uniref:Uncharacterized protein n=1 Tax=Ascochyta lentis TaxID=205686 RepID=A0A8H7J1Z3_9PLEO|nr:hypothetical protein EKO04_006477 [Ascochyta lentis]
MANSDADRSATRRNSNDSLGLVGVPSLQESAQTATEFDFDFDLEVGLDNELDAHIGAFCVNDGVTNGQSLHSLEIPTNLTPVKTGFDPAELHQSYLPGGSYSHSIDPSDYNSFPVTQTYEYPQPQHYYTPQETPYFNDCFSSFAPSGDFFGTPGLTAIPGNSAIAGYGISQYPSSHPCVYPTQSWALPVEVVSFPNESTGYLPVDTSSYNDTAAQFVTYPHEAPPTIAQSQTFETGFIPASNTYGNASPVNDEGKLQGLDSADDGHQRTKTNEAEASTRAAQKQRRNISVSSDSSSAEPPSEPVKYIPGEKPKKVDAKPWIRTNANTEGDTRTAKINNWKNRYEYKPLPTGPWSSGKHTFKYTGYENVDFLTEAPMSTRKIKEYIMKYPCDDNRRLILWIQKMPADQGRRYGSRQHSKCVFRDCPIQRYVEGTISTGEYRVAFDEKHYTYGDQVDPYDCAAYAHLYCMEQFLDFEQVCQVADVRVDTRLDMPLEPNGKAAFSMVDVPARHEMECFIKAASKGKLRYIRRWHNYPVHVDYKWDEQKPHEHTLTYLAHRMYEAHQDDSHKKQAALRRVTVSQRRVHLGDLEMSVADKRIMIEVFGGKKKGRKGRVEDHYDERIRYQIDRAKHEAEDFLKEKRQTKSSNKKGKRRRTVELEGTDDEESMHEPSSNACRTEQQTHATPPRKTRAPRNKTRPVNYAESPANTQREYAQMPCMQPPADDAPEQLQQLQTYMATDFGSETVPVHEQVPIDPVLEETIDTAYGLYAIPKTPNLDISNFPTCEEEISDDNLEKLLALERRQSCAADIGTMSILKSPDLTRSGRTPRRAGFDAHPVSSSKEYFVNDPPSLVAVSKHVPLVTDAGRRSARIAAKTSWPQQTVGERRMRKRARLS